MTVFFNKTISISRLGTGTKRTWTTVQSGVSAYINQIQEDMVTGFDGAGSFFAYRMLTNNNHQAIAIGDRIADGTLTYEVRGVSPFSDLTGDHNQYLLIVKGT